MEPVFLAFSFRDEDRALAADVEHLLASHDVPVVTGQNLGGQQLTPAVQERIAASAALIALLTRRDQLAGGGWTTHPWVQDELNYARHAQKRAIALVEAGVQLGGMYQEHEYIPFDRANALPAFLRLSDTVRIWKRDIGRTVIVQIKPDEAAQLAVQGAGACQYRFFRGGEFTGWRDAQAVEAPGGTLVYIRGVEDDHMIQISVSGGQREWRSRCEPQWVQVSLKEAAGQ